MRTCDVILALITLSLSPGLGQQPAELKHFFINSPKGWPVSISAENMAPEAMILHLKGCVEIKTADRTKRASTVPAFARRRGRFPHRLGRRSNLAAM